MRIEDALSQVRVLQVQVARTEQFQCYRWATVAVSGFVALGAAVLQSVWIADPVQNPRQFLQLWISVAVLNAAIVGAEILARWYRFDSPYARHQTHLALRQFIPSLIAGALLTWTIQAFCPEHVVLLPGLWSILFSLGLFASCPYLPSGGTALASYYLMSGLVCLRWGQAEQALQPWTMLLTFGVGQLMTAVILYRQQERADDAP